MPLFGPTPESLLGRSDSKNPATTCRGITSSGRPCRRALAKSVQQRTSATAGVVAIIEDDDEDLQYASANTQFYCWQHKDQVIHRAVEDRQQEASPKRNKPHRQRPIQLYPVDENTSLETMVQRLGIQDEPLAETHPSAKSSGTTGVNEPFRFEKPERQPRRGPRKQKPAPPGFWASLCCTSSRDDDDYIEVIRHRKRVNQTLAPTNVHSSIAARREGPVPPPSRPPVSPSPTRKPTFHSETGDILSLIPRRLPPRIATNLLNELVKPINPTDEAGYIYIFWLTPNDKAPDAHTAQSLLTPPSDSNRPARQGLDRRVSDVMTEFSFSPDDEPSMRSLPGDKPTRRTIMLKIGRASNVTRRMNEWQRQCGYALSLIRWYPHVPTSNTPGGSPAASPARHPHARRQSEDLLHGGSPGPKVTKVPSVKRVERLIHLELADAQVLRQCDSCGREHREWFQVEATQRGIRSVDECIKRWVRWAEQAQSR